MCRNIFSYLELTSQLFMLTVLYLCNFVSRRYKISEYIQKSETCQTICWLDIKWNISLTFQQVWPKTHWEPAINNGLLQILGFEIFFVEDFTTCYYLFIMVKRSKQTVQTTLLKIVMVIFCSLSNAVFLHIVQNCICKPSKITGVW